MKSGIPHPIPYQGSKRALAHHILSYFPKEKVCLHEPFAGSAAVSIAAVANGFVHHVVLNDINIPLMRLWEQIIEVPQTLIAAYEHLWFAQSGNERQFYDTVREEFNRDQEPKHLLYLLARCVKASVRYNAQGAFNQSPDNRRKGARPDTIAKHIMGASQLLHGRTSIKCGDFRDALVGVDPMDLVYMDPPYQGVCGKNDNRYLSGVSFDEFVAVLREMNRRRLSFIISYDGRTGEKNYGTTLPEELNLDRIEIFGGVSTQATLLGRNAETVESLYLSPALVQRISPMRIIERRSVKQIQRSLF